MSTTRVSTYTGGGNVTIQTTKTEWKAAPKVGSTDNIKHKPGGGNVKVTRSHPLAFQIHPSGPVLQILDQKLDLKVQSKVGSMGNIKHKPGGGDKKVFNDVDYLRQTSSALQSGNASRTSSRRESTTQVGLFRRDPLRQFCFSLYRLRLPLRM